MVEMSEEMEQYFERIQNHVDECYKLAGEAREKGYDPELYVECPQARDLAGRVEKLVGPEGVADVIRKLKNKGLSEDEITFKVVSDILDQKIGKIEDLEQRVERAIRVGLAIKTMGVVSAPLEGISKIKIRENQQGGEYLSVYFAGPIRAAGGTTAGLCVLIADFVRKKSGIPKYEATESEIGRFVEEVQLYNRVVNLQYPAKDQEIRFAVEHLPVEINGDSTRNEEVSAFRNLPRIETNQLRGGACLVLNDGILLKSPKLLKIADNMDLEGWDWLGKIKKIAHKEAKEEKKEEKAPKEHENKKKVAPNGKYIADIIAGRPVFSYPSRIGGHRIRYGRSRNTGLAAGGFHPATMELMDRFVAIGTQLRTERPGKSTSICPVSSIEPPIVKVKSGDVIRVNSVKQARQVFSNIERILFIGDILFGFGEFAENNHKLLPSGYVEEWWAAELEEKLEEENHVDEKLRKIINDPFNQIPTANEALAISKKYKIPLHPKYTDFWGNVSVNELITLRNAFLEGYKEDEQKIALDFDPEIKAILEKAFVIHNVKDDQIIFSRAMNTIYITIFNLEDSSSREFNREGTFSDFFNEITSIEIKHKAPYYMGTRMGRPEKSQRKSMKGVHTLFPLSTKVGNTRLVENAMKLGKIKVDICRKKCTKCGAVTIFNQCTKCGGHTELQKICKRCNELYPKNTDQCPKCQGNLVVSDDALFNFKKHVGNILNNLKFHLPDKMKGIYGLTNRFSVPEPIEKGILRARNDVLVYKTAEIRYDATDIPLTHFKPKEVGISLEKLKDLGYTKDIKGDPIQSEDQIIELKVQDVILSDDCANYMVKVANFLDDELDLFYGLQRFYNVQKKEDLIGELIVGLAPHTSAGIVGRVVGFSPARSIYSHPYWHAAKRRNCLKGSEEVIIWDSKKRILIVKKIEEIVEALLENGAKQEIIDDYGTHKIENLHPEWNTVSIDPINMEPILQPIKHWIKGKNNVWIKVTTQTGRTISMTPDHLAMTWNNKENSLEKIRASHLEVGDKIPIFSKISLPKSSPPPYVNILKDLSLNLPNSQKFKEFKQHVRLRDASDWIRTKLLAYARKIPSFSVSKKKYKRIQKKVRDFYINLLPSQPYKNPLTTKWYNSIPLSHLEILQKKGVFEWDDIPHDAILGMSRDDHIVNPYIPFNTNLMRLFGYYIAEGYIRDEKSCYQTNFSVPNPILRKHVRKLIIELLGSEPYFKEDNGQLVHTGRIHAYLFAYSYKMGKGAYSKSIPDFIYSLPESYRFSFLSAFIDGDGSIPKTDKTVLLYSASKKLLHEFGVLLSTLGIMFRKRKESPVGHYGKIILNRYKELGKDPKKSVVHHIAIRGPNLRILKKLKLENLEKKQNAEKILKKGYNNRIRIKEKNGRQILLKKKKDVILDPIRKIERISKRENSYCLEINNTQNQKLYNNLTTTMCATSNCDGDEDGVMLLLDPLLNFSRHYLPDKIGGRMDATLVISSVLDPNEIDTEAHNVDVMNKYPLEFYRATEHYSTPKEVSNVVKLVDSRLGGPQQYEGINYNIPTDDINAGPTTTAYKTYTSMDEKIHAQLHLGQIIDAVDEKDVARKIISSHFNPDILGNLRKFGQQEFRCVKCNTKFRRPPISNSGKCPKCGNNIILTVNRGGIEKYIPRAIRLCEEFDLDKYTVQRMELIEQYVESLTNNPRIKQQKLSQFF